MKVVIIGAGGHGQVVADILFHMWTKGRDVEIVGFLDDDPALEGRELLGLKVLGPVDRLDEIGHDAVIVAIGDNRTRLETCERLRDEQFVTAVHPSAVLAPDVSVKPGAMVCAGAVINPGTVVGRGAIVNTGSTVDHHNDIGEFSHVAPGVNLGGEVRVGPGALVGLGASVVPRLRLGDWSVTGAGAVVTHDVPDGETWVGVPARRLACSGFIASAAGRARTVGDCSCGGGIRGQALMHNGFSPAAGGMARPEGHRHSQTGTGPSPP